MSHFSRIKTQFRHRDALIACLRELGYEVKTDAIIRGYHGEHSVDIAVEVSRGHGIGFVKNADGSFDMVADWWGVAGKGEQKRVAEIQARAGEIQKEYARKIVLEQTARDGFSVVSETRGEDGTIRIVVRRWA